MRCEQCGFENMQGRTVCGRCGARMVWEGPVHRADFVPPRAGWRKALYPLLYAFNRTLGGLFPQSLQDRIAAWLPWIGVPALNRFAVFLSLVPGLGHVFRRQYGQGALFFGGWLILLWLTLTLFVGTTGYLLLSLLLSLHMSAAITAGELQNYGVKTFDRLRNLAPVVLLLAVMYCGGYFWIRMYYGFADVPNAHEKLGLEAGDRLLVRYRTDSLAPGQVATVEVERSGGTTRTAPRGMLYRFYYYEEIPILLIAGPESEVTLQAGVLRVNGQPIQAEWLPEGGFPDDVTLRIRLPDGWLARPLAPGGVLRVPPGNTTAPPGLLYVPTEALVGRAVSVYAPWSRKRNLDRLPLASP